MLFLLISVCSFLYLLVLAWLWGSDMMRSTASIKKSSRKQPDPPPCLCRPHGVFGEDVYAARCDVAVLKMCLYPSQ